MPFSLGYTQPYQWSHDKGFYYAGYTHPIHTSFLLHHQSEAEKESEKMCPNTMKFFDNSTKKKEIQTIKWNASNNSGFAFSTFILYQIYIHMYMKNTNFMCWFSSLPFSHSACIESIFYDTSSPFFNVFLFSLLLSSTHFVCDLTQRPTCQFALIFISILFFTFIWNTSLFSYAYSEYQRVNLKEWIPTKRKFGKITFWFSIYVWNLIGYNRYSLLSVIHTQIITKSSGFNEISV